MVKKYLVITALNYSILVDCAITYVLSVTLCRDRRNDSFFAMQSVLCEMLCEHRNLPVAICAE